MKKQNEQVQITMACGHVGLFQVRSKRKAKDLTFIEEAKNYPCENCQNAKAKADVKAGRAIQTQRVERCREKNICRSCKTPLSKGNQSGVCAGCIRLGLS